MKNFLLKALTEDGSDVSMTRLMSFMCVISAMLVAVAGIYKGSNLSDVAILVGSFLVPSFGAKIMQKKSETEV